MRDGRATPRRLQTYAAPDVTVTFDPTRCIHAAECIRALPDVFDPARARWIRPERATAAEVVDAVTRCPTGALHYELPDGSREGALEGPAAIRVSRDGALYFRGDIRVVTEDGREVATALRVALCRCGASANQPYCDGSHNKVGFRG
jgi:uncharacterized Fe-S cluster protein YjdI/CDGSH-type Zn-finger protein